MAEYMAKILVLFTVSAVWPDTFATLLSAGALKIPSGIPAPVPCRIPKSTFQRSLREITALRYVANCAASSSNSSVTGQRATSLLSRIDAERSLIFDAVYVSASPSQYACGPLVDQGDSSSTGQARLLLTGVLSTRLNRLPCSPMYVII